MVVRSEQHRVFFSGDMGLTTEYATIRERLGTFSLAMHAWDEPVETLLQLAPSLGVPLLMPRLGEAVEPAHLEAVVPWWRGLDEGAPPVRPVEAPALQRELPWPLDGRMPHRRNSLPRRWKL